MPKQASKMADVGTSALKNILDSHLPSTGTLREILQKTDEAGAKKQTFILDARKFESKSLVASELHVCQGPAIIATNDAYFKPKDFLTVTDNLHILSGNKLLILNPHGCVLSSRGGVELDTRNVENEDGEIERKAYKDHFATFSAVLKPEDEIYPGTAIRLPLRNADFNSKLKITLTSVEGARNMFEDFIENELPDSMLFLKNIKEIKLLEIDDKGNQTILATANIEATGVVAPQRDGERTKQEDVSHQPITTTVQIGSDLPSTRNWIITHFAETVETLSAHMVQRLERPQRDVKAIMTANKLLPQVTLALPVPPDRATSTLDFRGRLFTLLPLPIITTFPVHIDAVLALDSSRRNLRNSMDVEVGSREELLVEWNRVIFSKLVPNAWASLLEHLAAQSSSMVDVFEAWPDLASTKGGDQTYWTFLPSRLLVAAADRTVWPLHGTNSQYSTLNGVLAAVEGESDALLQALEACNTPLVVVSERVLRLIEQSDFKEMILSPRTVYPYLAKNKHTIPDLDAASRELICDYLVSANDISLILDLPLIPQVQGTYTSISAHTTQIMATRSEAALFGNVDQSLLAEDLMSAATRQLILNDPARRVRPVGPADVARYLEAMVPTFGIMPLVNISAGMDVDTFEWLVDFWEWLDGWEKFNELVDDSAAWNTILSLYALPLRLAGRRSALRLVGRSAVRPGNMDVETVAALAALEVPVLHESVSNGSAIRYVSRDHGDITFILQNLPRNESFSHLGQATRLTLLDFFTQQLSNYLQPGSRQSVRSTLDRESRETLRNLPIFPIFSPGFRDDDNITLDVAPVGARFVNDSVKVIPRIRGTPFVSYRYGRILHLALEERGILGEIDVLRKTISPDAWGQQGRVTGLIPALVDRLINRLPEVEDATRARISELAIVEVGVHARRKSPSQVVDPSKPLAELYDAEDEVLPVGAFGREGPGSYIHQLRSYRMLRATLTAAAVEERLTRISDQSQPMQNRSEKALSLLGLLDSHTRSEGDWLPFEVVKMLCDLAWLPIGNRFHTPSECWDSRKKDLLLCDMVLPSVSFTVGCQQLRDYLGWSKLAFDALQSQLLKVLEADSGPLQISERDILDRIEAVLREVATRFRIGSLSQQQIKSLAGSLGSAAWVPTNSRARCTARRGMLEEIDLGIKYHSVAPDLLSFPGMTVLLRQMGIGNRPSQASLLSTLREISNELSESGIDQPTRNRLVRASISILDELGRKFQGKESEYQKILIPTRDCKLAPAREVLFNDMGEDTPAPPSGFQFAHPLVSTSLANTLGLRRMSEEEFAQSSEEDPTVWIRRVLQDYGIDHASNEWMASADDAGAKSVTFLVDEASFHGRRVVCGLGGFESGPALVVHNDGVLKDEDFRRLGNIGQGGKAGRADSIGRFGLGALSFYHFSELPWVISGQYCMFLDPSNQFLPRVRGSIKSSAALVPLSFCRDRYPDQLKPLEGLFGFSSEADHYSGTLFRLPLRTASQAVASKLSATHFSAVDIMNQINRFYSYARRSLFFTTSLAEISALRRTADLHTLSVWSVTSTRGPISHGVPSDIEAANVFLKMKPPQSSDEIAEHWIVTQSKIAQQEFPAKLQALFPLHRLPTPTFGLAAHLSSKNTSRNSYLFSTLPLPVSTSLPVHVHATWILAQDRRSIRYDAADAANRRPDDTLYNVHLLEKGVAPLYVKTLALILRQHPTLVEQFWPEKAQDGPSQTVAAELYRLVHQEIPPKDIAIRPGS